MKAFLTFIAVVFFGTLAMAQSPSKDIKVETITMEITLDIEIKKENNTNNEVARLYKFKNSRIKKALAFRTKKNRSKLA